MKNKTVEELAELKNVGGAAERAHIYLRPFLEKSKDNLIQNMVHELNEGQKGFDDYAGAFKLLISIEDKFKQDIKRGNQAAKELHDGIEG